MADNYTKTIENLRKKVDKARTEKAIYEQSLKDLEEEMEEYNVTIKTIDDVVSKLYTQVSKLETKLNQKIGKANEYLR